MKASYIIPAILSIIAGIFALAYPVEADVIIFWIVVFIVLISAIGMIIYNVKNKDQVNRSQSIFARGSLGVGIVLLILALLVMIFPAIRETLMIIFIIIFAISLIARGIDLLRLGIVTGGGIGVLNIICGIILMIAGINGIISIFSAAITMGIFIGIGLIVFGLTLLISGPMFQFQENR